MTTEKAKPHRQATSNLSLANRITEALHPGLYGKPGNSWADSAMLVGTRGIIEETLNAHQAGPGVKRAPPAVTVAMTQAAQDSLEGAGVTYGNGNSLDADDIHRALEAALAAQAEEAAQAEPDQDTMVPAELAETYAALDSIARLLGVDCTQETIETATAELQADAKLGRYLRWVEKNGSNLAQSMAQGWMTSAESWDEAQGGDA